VLGYCLGGTLATIHAAVHQEHVASLLLLAAPVSFGENDGILNAWTRTPTFDVRKLVDAFGNVPWQLLQSAFHLLRPTLNLSKTVHLLDRAANDEFLDGFLALETWGNDNVSFPGECYVRYIEELYRNDALARGTFTLSGKSALLSNITCPTMCVVFEHDNIVPWQSASTLVDRIRSTDKELVKLPGGHVGAVVSRAAQKNLWPRLSAFWANRDVDPTERASVDGTTGTPSPARSVAHRASPPSSASTRNSAPPGSGSGSGSGSVLTPLHAAFGSPAPTLRPMVTTPALAYVSAMTKADARSTDRGDEQRDTADDAPRSMPSETSHSAAGNRKKKKGRSRGRSEADR
jgi:polyhydroxyalkanoate synthase